MLTHFLHIHTNRNHLLVVDRTRRVQVFELHVAGGQGASSTGSGLGISAQFITSFEIPTLSDKVCDISGCVCMFVCVFVRKYMYVHSVWCMHVRLCTLVMFRI